MQKKKEKLLDKFVKKDYNNELEMILERKAFDESAKNLLLNILYKIEASYKDYEKIKRNVPSKDEYIEKIINIIDKKCENISICKMNSEKAKLLGDKAFLVDKNNKKIICYPIERNLLYCIAKIGKREDIINKKDYPIIYKALSNLITIGNNIEMEEPLRDFNGYSWVTIHKEIESIIYNGVYQNLRILLGYHFLEKWANSKELSVDYMAVLNNELEQKYGTKNQKDIIEIIEKLSFLLELKYYPDEKEKLEKEKKEIEDKQNQINNIQVFIKKLTEQKTNLMNDIKVIDQTINHENLLQEEYNSRNEKLPVKQKIMSITILYELMVKEREKKLLKIQQLNDLLNPKKFIQYKMEIEQKYMYLKLLDAKNLEKEAEKLMIKLQKIFLKCYRKKIEEIKEKSKITDSIYEFRYYNLLPFNEEINIKDVKEIQKELMETKQLLIDKAQELKVIIITSKNEVLDDEILKNMFDVRMISLENLYIKLTKEKDKVYIQLFDEDMFEQKIELKDMQNLNNKMLETKLNKKVKVFN